MTLEISIHAWFVSALLIFMGGKLMQASGILFARGQDWHLVTLIAALCIIGPIFFIGFMLLVQNVQ